MLRRENRLRLGSDFRRVRRRGQVQRSELVTLHVLKRTLPRAAGDTVAAEGAKPRRPILMPPPEAVRAGVTVSKRVGKATVRNRVKRRLREGLRANLGQVKPGYDLILTARPPAASATYGEIRHAIEDLLKRSRLLQEPIRHA